MRALLLVLALAATARADGDKAKAEQYFRAGAQAYKANNFAAAAEDFELAYQEVPLPEVAFSAAQAHRRQYGVDQRPSHVARAVELYRIYLDAVKSGGRVGDAADEIAQLQRELDRLRASGQQAVAAAPAPPRTRLAISIVNADEAKGAIAAIDGKPVELFAGVDVGAGKHAIAVSAPAFFPVALERVAVDGASDVVEVTLVAKPAVVALHTEDGARIAVDGRGVGTAPLAPLELAAGKHAIAVLRRGRESELRELQLGRDQRVDLAVPLERTAQRRAVPWLVGGAGALAVASGITAALAISADHRASDLAAMRTSGGITEDQERDLERQLGRRNDDRSAAIVLGGAALATGAIALALWYFDVPTRF